MAKMSAEAKKKFLARMARGRKAAAGKGMPTIKKKAGKKRTKKAASKAPRKAKTPKGLAAKVASISARLHVVEHNDAANQNMWLASANQTAKQLGHAPLKTMSAFNFKKPRVSLGYATPSKRRQLGAGK